MRRTRGVLVGLICTVLASTLAAQRVAAPGTRARVVGAKKTLIADGAFVRLAGDTVVLKDVGGTTRALVLQPGHRLEISVGMRSRTLRGMGIGWLAGAATGAILGAVTFAPRQCDDRPVVCVYETSRATRAAFFAVYLGIPGTILGGILGSEQREWWVPVSTHAARVTLWPTGPHSGALVLTASF